MTKEFYEFLFNLRGGGFIHNTPENTKKMLYHSLSVSDPQFAFDREPNGMLKGNWLDGEIGSFSADNTRNLRNAVISISSILSVIAIQCKVDQELSHILCDFYINKAETIKNYTQFDEIISEMFSEFHEQIMQSNIQAYGPVIDRCIEYINQKLYSPLKLEEIAEYMGYSPSYLSALFKEKTGMSIHPYIQKRKIEAAKGLILYTNQSLTAIAAALGYHSLSHLSKAFKKEVGVSPQQYRLTGKA